MPRQARLDAPGTLHHVIVRGIEKRRIVDDDKDRKTFVNRMARIAENSATILYAWALMDNHAHILLRSGPSGLPHYMRRFLTGYAKHYNRRHERYGHLFQNRYKSIVCDEDTYLKILVRYIHLNPLRAGTITNIQGLAKYEWCGHGVIMGLRHMTSQDTNFVLRYFGACTASAREAYQHYLLEDIAANSDGLIDGGLEYSKGEWSAVKSLRQRVRRRNTKDRILGDDDFAERIVAETTTVSRCQYPTRKQREKITAVIVEQCQQSGISINELQMGGRRRVVSRVRRDIARRLFSEFGIPLADIARYTGVSTSAICKALWTNN